MRVIARIVIVAGVVAFCAEAMASGWRLAYAAGASTLTATAMVASAADAIVSDDPLNYLNPTDPFGVLAHQDEALARSAQAFAVSDPARSQRYLTAATAIADYLVQKDALESDGKIGWGLPRAWDAFGDGTINPPNQIYAFQTALVSQALLDMYAITQNSAYLAAVESAMANYAPSGSTSFAHGCQGCFLFWYSTNANDAGRYVKNTNVLMGLVEGQLYQLTGDIAYQSLASAIYNEEAYEVVQHGNVAYLGIDDPKYNPATGPDTHIVLETYAYSQVAALLGLSDSQTRATFDGMVTTFWQCGAACLAAPIAAGPATTTSVYAQFMACYPVAFDTTFTTTCERMFTNPYLTNLLPFPLIGLLYAMPSLPASMATPTSPRPRLLAQGSQPAPAGDAPVRAPLAPPPHGGALFQSQVALD